MTLSPPKGQGPAGLSPQALDTARTRRAARSARGAWRLSGKALEGVKGWGFHTIGNIGDEVGGEVASRQLSIA
jgi:hypothetical protein